MVDILRDMLATPAGPDGQRSRAPKELLERLISTKSDRDRTEADT